MAQDDFKYTMQDLYKVYFGVNSTYREILENEDAYYKFSPEADVYRQIGARVKLSVPTVRKSFLGREEKVYKEEIWKASDLFELTAEEKERKGIVLSELQIPKIKLREFAI